MSICGAEYRKADLQIHSPRDRNWEGARPEDSLGTNPTEDEIKTKRKEYCRDFIQKCLTEGLQVIAITDHHEGVYTYIAIETKKQMEAEQGLIDLWILPGMELTCKDSSQALIIFDADLPKSLFEKARNILGLPTECFVMNKVGIEVDILNHNIEVLQDLLQNDGELRDRFLILPHVKPGGHKTVLRTGFHKRFKEMPYIGGYMDCCYPHELQEGDRRILDGEIPAWSSEKRGVISTSDARHADFRLIGKHASWIKLALPTAESLRQAMLAPDSRIRHENPKLPDVVIERVTIEGANYLNNDQYILNRQMNSIIGGRGAGKSSFLEYIRFALGCSALDSKDAQVESPGTITRMREMLKTTFDSGGRITLDIRLNGAPVSVQRLAANPKLIEVQNNGNISKNTADDICKLIPIQSFRQGELSDLGREELANRLLELITANASDTIQQIETELRNNGDLLADALSKVVRLSSARQRKTHLETELSLLKSQIESIQKQLVPKIEENAAITTHKKYISEQQNIEKIMSVVENARVSIGSQFSRLVDSLAGILENRSDLKIDKLDIMYQVISDGIAEDPYDEHDGPLLVLGNDIDSALVGFGLQLKRIEEDWQKVLSIHQREYEEQKAALTDQKNLIAKMDDLTARVKQVSEDLEKALFSEREFKAGDEELKALRVARQELHQRLVRTVSEQIDSVYEKSSQLVRGQLSNNWDYGEIENAVRTVLAIPQIREKRIEETISIIKDAANPLIKWEEVLDEMIMLLKTQEGDTTEETAYPETPILLSTLDQGFLDKLKSNISSDRVAEALRVVIRPKVDIFQQRQGGEIEFRKASQGEQAASLLNILMNQSRGPLIIDQPEEDLDNNIVNDIIKTIRKTKDDRQLILATHNANIVVNGDSENVFEMCLGKKNACGAIDEPEIRSAITLTMEGGKDAFELRRKKYNY